VEQYGVSFELTDDIERELRKLGADDRLLLVIAKRRQSSQENEQKEAAERKLAEAGKQEEARDEAAQAQAAREQSERDARDRVIQEAQAKAERDRDAQEEASGVWSDPVTGLMWTKKDNGRDVGWQQAVAYCRNLQLAGHSDWRLPEIEELQSIYDRSVSIPGHFDDGKPLNWHVKGNLKLSGVMEWSKTSGPQEPTTHSAAAWTFYFFSYERMREFLDWGKRSSFSFDYRYDGCRALCVRANTEALLALGLKYKNGEGVPQDDAQAAVWFRKAAELGNSDAQMWLGFMYEEGHGVPKDDAQGIAWIRKSAEQGNAPAQIELGAAYQLGQGAPQDYAQAASWYRKAAMQGNADAQVFLGDLYKQGKGTSQDDVQAGEWYRKAAEQGDARAQASLGAMYAGGFGGPPDYAEAYFWFDLAAAGNSEDAAKARNEAAPHLTPADLARVEERARKWFEEHPAKP
jgi:TPR repeat protein